MQPGLLDHVVLGLFTVALPLYASIVLYPKNLQALRDDVPGRRERMYRRTIVVQWVAAASCVWVWLRAGRPLDDLGLGVPGERGFYIAAGIVVLLGWLLHRQLGRVQVDADLRDELRQQIDETAPFAPRTAVQMRWFVAVSVTAGICEELLMRGYLLAYLEHFFGIWTAVVASSMIFGLGHLYQGTAGMVKTTLAGLIAVGIYLLSGSLWLPMLLHAFVDINAGQLSLAVHHDAD